MKTRIFTVICLASGLGLGTPRAFADLEVSAEISVHSQADFYQPLAPRGAWVEVGSYGRCWHPAGVTAEWRPYCQGDWVWTDCGWYWESDEPWAWACYHYGTWVLDPSYGWVWVPGVEWAPAWVNWRTGGDYIGWAPCGPSGFVVEPAFFVFVENRHFHDRVRPNTVIVNNTTIINRTREIRSTSREERPVNGRKQTVVVNEGPSVAAVEKATGHRFTATPIQKVQETTIKTAPAELRHRTTESKSTEPQHVTEPHNNNIPSKQEVVPNNRNIPERTIPEEHKMVPNVPERTIPEHNIPDQVIPERTIPKHTVPEVPAEKVVPPVNEMPRDRIIEHPHEIVPPTQPTRPVSPVVPEKVQPTERGNDQGGGNERKDRQDHP